MRMHDVLELAVANQPPHGNSVEDIVNRGRRCSGCAAPRGPPQEPH
jgi:hypothetical protein